MLLKNNKFQFYLDQISNIEVKNYSMEISVLEKIIFPKFFEWSECILLDQGMKDDLPLGFSSNAMLEDRTAFEANYNHIHMNDLFDDPNIPPIEVFRLSVEIASIWEAVLKMSFSSKYNIIIVLSFDGEDVVLRCYTKRSNEPPWINVNALNNYLDGVMVIDF